MFTRRLTRVGIDFAFTGIKITVRARGRNDHHFFPYPSGRKTGFLEADLLRAFVRERRLEGCPARVALRRSDVLLVNLPHARSTDPISALPSAHVDWRWTVASFEAAGTPVLVATTLPRINTLRDAVEHAGLRFDGAQFPMDPFGQGAAWLEIGAGGVRLAFRNANGLYQHHVWQGLESARNALQRSKYIDCVHLAGGGALNDTTVRWLHETTGKIFVPPPSVASAIFRAAELAMFGENAVIAAHDGPASPRHRPISTAAPVRPARSTNE